MELAEYLTSIILFNHAKEMFKLASDSTDDPVKKEKALLKMIEVEESHAAYMQAFKNKVQAKEFYIRLPKTFIK
jgi:hypothetical protein